MNQTLKNLQAIEGGFTMADEEAIYARFVELWPDRRNAETRQELQELLATIRWMVGEGT